VTGGAKKKPGAAGTKGKKPASSDATDREEPMEKELTVCYSTANKYCLALFHERLLTNY